MLHVMQVLHQGGGAGSVFSTLHLSIRMLGEGVRVRFVCPPGTLVEAAAVEAGLTVVPLRLEAGQHRRNAGMLEGLLARDPVDLVNSQSSRDRAALTWLGLRGRLRVPVIFTRRQMPRTFWLENWIASRVADRVIAVSSTVAEALIRRGTPREKIVVIPNGLIPSRVDSAVSAADLEAWRRRIGWEGSRRTIGIVSRKKDQAVVLRALREVGPPVRLVMAGTEETPELLILAAVLPERHAVSFVPFDPDVRPLYDLLEVVLLPSRTEGLSQTLLEAMALGKPVIASAAAGNLDLITDQVDGLLVPPLDPTAWAKAIERILGDYATAHAMGQAARHTARVGFSLDHTVARTLRLYRELVPGAGAATPS
jgi:glycosyltransferase involved in cell wall biosynthesis